MGVAGLRYLTRCGLDTAWGLQFIRLCLKISISVEKLVLTATKPSSPKDTSRPHHLQTQTRSACILGNGAATGRSQNDEQRKIQYYEELRFRDRKWNGGCQTTKNVGKIQHFYRKVLVHMKQNLEIF